MKFDRKKSCKALTVLALMTSVTGGIPPSALEDACFTGGDKDCGFNAVQRGAVAKVRTAEVTDAKELETNVKMTDNNTEADVESDIEATVANPPKYNASLAQTRVSKTGWDRVPVGPHEFSTAVDRQAAGCFLGCVAFLTIISYAWRHYLFDEPEDFEKNAMETVTNPIKMMARGAKALKKQSSSLDILAVKSDISAWLNFMFHADIAMRAAFFATLGAVTVMWPPLADWYASMRYDTQYACLCVIFTLDKTYAATKQNYIDMMFGTCLAFFLIWFAQGVYPGGNLYDNGDAPWYFGVVYFMLCSGGMLTLNFPTIVKLWCLSYFTGYMMTFLKLKSSDDAVVFSRSFHVDPRGQAFGYCIVSAVGGLLALLASSLPKPNLAHRKALSKLKSTSEDMKMLLNTAVMQYTDGKSTLAGKAEMAKNAAFGQSLDLEFADMDANIANSWLEHYDWGVHGAIRHYLSLHVQMSREMLSRVTCIQSAQDNVDFDSENHKALVKAIEKPLNDLKDATLELYKECTDATVDGKIDDEEADKFKTKIANVLELAKKLSDAFKGSCEKIAGKDFAKQSDLIGPDYIIAYCYCVLARLVVTLAERLVKADSIEIPRVTISAAIRSYFAKILDFKSKAKLNFALRNTLSMWLCYLIGYTGFGNGLMPSLNAGIATNVALLLSSFVGSALQKNLFRLQGLVLGTCFGQLVHALLIDVGCGTPFMIGSLTAVFFWTAMTFYMYVSSPVYGYMGNLLAGLGTMQMLRSCPLGAGNDDAASESAYVGIISAIVAVTVMTLVDLCLASKSAAKIATEAVDEYLFKCKDAVAKVFQNNAEAVEEVMESKDELLGNLTNVRVMVDEALKEPRLWRKPFPSSIYVHISTQGKCMLMHLMMVNGALAGVGNALKKLAGLAPDKINSDPMTKLGACSGMKELQSSALTEYDQTLQLLDCVMKKEKATDIEALYATLAADDSCGGDAMQKVKQELATEIAKGTSSAQNSGNDLTEDSVTRLHIIVQGLNLLGNELSSIQKQAYLAC